jgi:hypothetical protein
MYVHCANGSEIRISILVRHIFYLNLAKISRFDVVHKF